MFADEDQNNSNKKSPLGQFLKHVFHFAWWKVGLVCLVLAGLAAYPILTNLLRSSVVATVQAEQMILPSGAAIINSSAASDSRAVKLSQNGASLTGSVNLPASATSMTISARGDSCQQGWPTLSASVDGAPVIASDLISSSNWRGYSVKVSLKSTAHNLKITDTSAQACRSLYVDDIVFYGPTAAAPEPAVSFSATPAAVTTGSASNLTWNSTNASSCKASSAWTGNQPLSGSFSTGALNTTEMYSLTCSGVGGKATAIATVTVTPAATASGNPTCQSVIIPAYFAPSANGDPWFNAIGDIPGVGALVANPDNGPGTVVDTTYQAAIENARAAGIAVYGYVDTNRTADSIASVEANINTWKKFYNVTDIFFDNVPTGIAEEVYYQTLSTYVHQQTPGSQTILNTSAVPDQSYMNAGDIIVTYDGDYNSYQDTSFPSWVGNYSASRFYNIIYNVPDQTIMQNVLDEAQTNNVSYVYATNAGATDTFGTLPPYLSVESKWVESNCAQ
ncbi:MAG TPA: spherulation-specific family 4 protein [Candidatus Saccharimonadales bacterium]|nr:spherulation-specific family 4 protein [Candidatus Saccharimonadales bacterium]